MPTPSRPRYGLRFDPPASGRLISKARRIEEVRPAMRHPSFHHHPDLERQSFLLQRVQPGLSGFMDGSLSTLAPIFAVVLTMTQPV